tara:strand:- start:1617 stop:2021 length:405 start_codon:yes stop_codon:yes gene_type:complete
MIPTFEEHTQPLSDYEKNTLLPLLIKGFKTKVGVENCITNPQICSALRKLGYKVTQPRVRKIVFYIRNKNMIPKLIASSKGYWIATNKRQVISWLDSVNSKISALEQTKKYAENIISQWDAPPPAQTNLFNNGQ